MQRPQDHQLYHQRQYPPYAPCAEERRSSKPSVIPFLMVLVLAVLGAWGFAKIDSSRAETMAALQAQPVDYRPSEAAEVYALEPDEGGPAISRDAAPSVSVPSNPDRSERELGETLTVLAYDLKRTERLAQRVGQLEAYGTLQAKQAKLSSDVASRAQPLSESDRAALKAEARHLQAEVAKFSEELEEVASVQL